MNSGNNEKGKVKMRMVLATAPLTEEKVIKPKYAYPKTSSMLLISAAISIAIVLLTFAATLPTTEGWFEQYSDCRDKIIGFQQMGLYKSPEDFSLALSYCDLK